MTTVTVRPNAYFTNELVPAPDPGMQVWYGGAYHADVAAHLADVLGDDDPAGGTWIYQDSVISPPYPQTGGVKFAPPVLPAGARILYVQVRLAMAADPIDNGGQVIQSFLGNDDQEYANENADVIRDGTLQVWTGQPNYLDPKGDPWTLDTIAELHWQGTFATYPGRASAALLLFGVYLDVVVQTPATLSIDDPAEFEVLTASTRPTIAWTVTSPDTDPVQLKYRLRVFTRAVAIGAGFDPWSSQPALWDSGAVLDSDARSAEVGVDLPNGDYVVWLRDTQPFEGVGAPAMVDQGRNWTQTVPVPDPPTIQAAWGTDTGIRLRVLATHAWPATVTIEGSDDDGATWFRAVGPHLTADDPQVFNDLEAPIGKPRRYRAYVTDQTVGSIDSLPSAEIVAARQSATAILMVAGSTSLIHALEHSDLQIGARRPQTVVDCLGADFASIIHDGYKGRTGSVTFWSMNPAERALIETILASPGPLLYLDVLGRVVYFQPTDNPQWDQHGAMPLPDEVTPVRDLHSVTMQFNEVRRPA